MSLSDFARTQLIEIIEWVDDSRDTLAWRWPDDDRAIKRGAKLVVRESQAAQLVYLGQFADQYGPGTHTLTTDNIPVLTRLRGWKYGLESPFKADVYFVTTRLFTGNQWGTSNPVMVRDPELGAVRLRAFGTYDFRVVDAARFLKEVAGTDAHFQVDKFAEAMRSRIVSVLSEALAQSHLPALDIASRYREVGEALLPLINPVLTEKYGLALASFVVENVSLPPEVEQALDKRSSMAAIGNLTEFVKYQMGLGIEHGAGAGVAGIGAQMAVGAGIAQQFMPQGAPPSAAAAAQGGDILTPAEAAAILRVNEADVVASLDKGDLKGKKIGGQWRVTRGAVDDFLR